MVEDGGAAFTHLFSQRRDELGLSVVDIAARTGRPIEVVVGWGQGTAVPDEGHLGEIARILKLPKPLLEEALRRVAEHRMVDYRVGALSLDRRPDGPPEQHNLPPAVEKSGDAEPGARSTATTRYPPADLPAAFSLSTVWARLRQYVTRYRARRRRLARAPTAQPSYMEDRDELITYRLRMVFTVAGLAALGLILRWSLGGLGSAITDLWRALTGAL